MIRDNLKNLSEKEKSNKKAEEIAKLDHVRHFKINGLKIEILDQEKIEGGLRFHVKAWRGKKQLGFMDGSVEIETINIYNPPILVPDENGDIVQEWDEKTPTGINHRSRKLKEDPIRAIQETLYETVRKIGKEDTQIVKGKVGTTTSVFYSGSGDGYSAVWESTSSWATIHAATTGNDTSAGDVSAYAGFCQHQTSGSKTSILRAFYPFDTSSIPDTDVISSATLTLYSTGTLANGDNDGDNFIAIVQTSQASNTTLANGDYDTCGDAETNPTEGATRISLNSWSNGAGNANVFTLNATGIGWISKTGYTKLGAREGHDVKNNQIANNTSSGAAVYLSETSGTSTDPTLTVTHAAPTLSNLKTWNGIAKASVKTRNGVAIASIKTANGIT